MLALYDQIQELRAEFASSLSVSEREQIACELAELERAQALDRAAFETAFAHA